MMPQPHQPDSAANVAFACASRIIAAVRALELECRVTGNYYGELHSRFRKIIESQLDLEFAGVEVFWTAVGEKPTKGELPAQPRDGDLRFPNARLINEVILKLNPRYHSHPLLSALAQFPAGRSHLFSVRSTGDQVTLRAYPLQAFDAQQATLFETTVSLNAKCTVAQFCSELNAIPNPEPHQVASRIEQQIAEWTADANWPIDKFLATIIRLPSSERSIAEPIAKQIEWQQYFAQAAQHIALIALYQHNNSYGPMSYVLASTLG
ncbi:MAG: hypothetical protein JNM18_08970, partial [Planctomycetaceae bacterium]|nr:hypothetical protein [Planctomycetaceae bacterium]